MRNAGRHRGLTLVECLLASVVMAVAVIAVTQAVVAGQMQTADALHRVRALELAEALMDEVLRLPYTDPDGTGGEVGRANFDDLADFNGFSEAATTLADAAGTAYASPFQVFSRSVTVVSAGGGRIRAVGSGNPLPGPKATAAPASRGSRISVTGVGKLLPRLPVTVVPAGGGGISVTGFGDPLAGLTVTVTVQDTAGATWALTRFRAQPPA